MADKLEVNGHYVNVLRDSIIKGESGLATIPELIKRIIKDRMWEERYEERLNKVVRFDNFIDFVTTPPLEGLGEDIKVLEHIIKVDDEALSEWATATARPPGKTWDSRTNNNHNNIMNNNGGMIQGTSATYALRKLRKDAPKIHQRVINGELSPHAGMVEAGFRKKTITIVADPELAARALRRHFADKEILTIIYYLNTG